MLEIALYIKNKIKKCPLYSYPLIRISHGKAADNKPRIMATLGLRVWGISDSTKLADDTGKLWFALSS